MRKPDLSDGRESAMATSDRGDGAKTTGEIDRMSRMYTLTRGRMTLRQESETRTGEKYETLKMFRTYNGLL